METKTWWNNSSGFGYAYATLDGVDVEGCKCPEYDRYERPRCLVARQIAYITVYGLEPWMGARTAVERAYANSRINSAYNTYEVGVEYSPLGESVMRNIFSAIQATSYEAALELLAAAKAAVVGQPNKIRRDVKNLSDFVLSRRGLPCNENNANRWVVYTTYRKNPMA